MNETVKENNTELLKKSHKASSGASARSLTPKQVIALKSTPTLFRGAVERSYKGISSPREAIKAKCAECVGFEDAVDRIGTCTTSTCPVWHYRPYQTKRV